MNIITIAGNLGRDAEIRYMPNGDPVASFSVADSPGKDKPTVWWNCSMFGKRAEALAPYLLKGGSVTVGGTVVEREWKDKDGTPRKSMDIRVNEIALQSKRGDDGKKAAASEKPRATPDRPPVHGGGFDDLEDDIPF